MRMIVVTNSSGQIVAAAHVSKKSSANGITCGIAPLLGQQITEIDSPPYLQPLSFEERLHAILDHRVQPGTNQLEKCPRVATQKK